MGKHKSIGSDFEDWIAEEGILEEVEVAATKKAFVIQLQAEMKKKKIGLIILLFFQSQLLQ